MAKNPAAVALGKLGGSATSEAKAKAARKNAKKAAAARWKDHQMSPAGIKRKQRREKQRQK